MKLAKAIKVVAGVVTVGSAVVVISNVLTKKGTESLEDMITRVHNEESEKLGISVPVVFTQNAGYLASCIYTVYKNFFTITGVDKAERIEYNVGAIQTLINSMFFTKKARTAGAEHVVRHTIRHELRHAWQTVNNKKILMNRGMLEECMDMVDGYGARPQEADANQYAEDIDMGKFNIVYMACTHNQNVAGKYSLTKEEIAISQKVAKGLLKLNLSLMF